MKISVIIPAYNEEENLGKTLDAILSSDYPNFEVIVADNASTDKTSAIAAAKGAKVIYEKRKGTSSAREAGRKVASGKILAFLDADCLPEKDWLSRGAKHFDDHRVVAVTGPYDYYDGPIFFRWFSLNSQKYIWRPVNSIVRVFNRGMLIEGNMFIRASTLETVGGFDVLITFYGDGTDTAKRLAPHGQIVFDKNLVLKTSARRFKREGTIKITAEYIFHFFRTAFFLKMRRKKN